MPKTTSPSEIVIATHNPGKLCEFYKIFSEYNLLTLDDIGITREIIENGATFLENARKKAIEIYEEASHSVIADDSGIEIDELNGFPGVLTHRWLGENATDVERNAELIRRASSKTVHFVCKLAYYDGSNFLFGHGQLTGKITTSPRGQNGFGFDPIFELPDGRTLAELSQEEKNQISARHLAVLDLVQKLHERS